MPGNSEVILTHGEQERNCSALCSHGNAVASDTVRSLVRRLPKSLSLRKPAVNARLLLLMSRCKIFAPCSVVDPVSVLLLPSRYTFSGRGTAIGAARKEDVWQSKPDDGRQGAQDEREHDGAHSANSTLVIAVSIRLLR